MRVNRILSVILLSALAALYVACFSTDAGAASVGQDYLITKGFVAAKNGMTLTLLASNRRIVVAITSNTRILGQRDSFAAIVPNDVVRAEGRMVGNRLLADRVEVVLAADSLRAQPQPKGPTIDVLTFDILPR
ncbi:MAG: hypothetical protein ACREJ4_17125 [Candidatus Methylomirabilaceae bacterium]